MEEKPFRASMVFQSSALLKLAHRGDNVSLALREAPHRLLERDPPDRARGARTGRHGGHGGEDASELSGGMRKRVAIARALRCARPDLYDEPTPSSIPCSPKRWAS